MIYLLSGSLILVIGVLFLLVPAQKPHKLYGYVTYLSQVNQDGFQYAQKVAGWTNVLTGLVQMGLGSLILLSGLNDWIFVWLLTTPIFFLVMFMVTEVKLEQFLKKRGELPHGYQKLDERPHKDYVKGFKNK